MHDYTDRRRLPGVLTADGRPEPRPRCRGAAARPLAIELVGISKSFGPVQANKDIHLAVRRGTIHGIVGENGAGKSTLMSILYGFYHADAGEIRIDGKPAAIPDSQAAIRAGIGMVHQHFMLVEPFTVLENVVLGAEDGPAAAPLARQGAGRAEAARGGIRARGRPRRGGRRALGRAAAAGRDPEGALPRVRHPDPRRADRRADPGRGRPPVPHPPAPEGARERRSSSSPTSCARSWR